jgi:hypothetical protein
LIAHEIDAVEGVHGLGRALAQRLVGDGEQVLDVPAKLAARVRVLSVGHGRKSDPHDAVSVAVAAQSVPQLRRVGVEDQAVVLHLLTKRREDLVAARTQTIQPPAPAAGRPGPRRRQKKPDRQPRRQIARPGCSNQRPGGHPPPTRPRAHRRRARPGPADRRGRGPHQDRGRGVQDRPWWSCSAWARCWPPRSSARSATCTGSRPSTTSPLTPAPPTGGLQRPGRPPSAVTGRGP